MARPSRFNQPSNADEAPAPRPSSNPSASTSRENTNPDDNLPEPANPTPGPSQPQASTSAVTGPTSALTSFLKEQGIRARNVNRFTPIRQNASTSTANAAIPEVPEEASNASSDSEPDSDNLDEKPEKKQKIKKPTKTNELFSASKAVASSSKKKNDKPEDPEPSKPKPGKYADRKPGLITTCAECGKRFTVTRYTISAPGQPGQLCDGCAQEVAKNPKTPGKDNNLPTPAPKKRKTTKNQVLRQPWSESSIQTLQMACINIIARNIQCVEELGNIGSVNLEKICQIVCKHRELTPSNLALFVDAAYSDLKLYDCINLRESHLTSIAFFCPRLERLTLNLCGHMTGDVLQTYVERLPRLRELDLFGPYLIRKPEWLKAFETWSKPRLVSERQLQDVDPDEMAVDDDENGKQVELIQAPQIQGFRLKQSPRFDIDCVKALVSSCSNLTSLRLIDIGLMNDNTLEIIAQAGLKKLTDLSIANAGIHNGATGEALTDVGVTSLLKSVGGTVEQLDISQNKKLTDAVLEGIQNFCPRLTYLDLNGLKELSTKGIQELFNKFKETEAPGLKHLNLSRCIKVGNEAVYSILDHSARNLRILNLNSVDELRAEALERLAREATNLENLDVSFVRDVDDFIIKAFLDHMKNLKSLSVYGNNRVSDLCPMRKGVTIRGQERSIVVT
ncbi:hypothetical protein PtA15_11A469 [Puccinia triticina]|uniref:DNA repair protein rhp7 treble clef domain-containing protein n=1 Tax=Puccinia triticina TaxID=208348 RepID=A0ABY7CXZ6_9BASI|nr:uncharacterized protein PtA15_11A469 [Puccinia triticina]WAQ89778.1 hypothetical protein PtA15_11A469 [Puccinia triticina]